MRHGTGILLIALALICCVQIVAAESPPTWVMNIGSYGSGTGQLNHPYGIEFRPTNPMVLGGDRLYVDDNYNNRLAYFGLSGESPGALSTTLSAPRGIAVSLQYAFIADSANHRIVKRYLGYTLGSNSMWGSYGTGNTNFNYPCSIAIDPSGTYLYVTDRNNHRVVKYTTSGTFVGIIGSAGVSGSSPGNGKLYYPWGIAVDPTNTYVYVTDNNNYVQRFTVSGSPAGYFGGSGTADGKFDYPRGLTCDKDGNIYVVDSGNSRVQRFSKSYTFLSKFGTLGSGNGQLAWPTDVALDASGNIYVTDTNNNRISKWKPAATAPLTAGFTATPNSGARPLTVQFTDRSSGAASWEYSFGDGTSSTTQSPSHQYKYGGGYYVRQTIRNGANSQSADAYIAAHTSVPARIEAEDFDGTPRGTAYTDTTTGNSGGAYRTTDVDIEAGGSGYSIGWIAEGETLSYTIWPQADGTYPLTFRACAWSPWRTIEILVDGVSKATVTTPQTGSSSAFGDVSTTLRLISGPRILTLKFHGGSQNIDYFAFGSISAPTASFAISPNPATVGQSVQFTDTSTGSPTVRSWTFGDSGTSTATSPTHTYTTAGTYTVTLTVYNAAGSNSKSQSVTVNPAGSTHTAVKRQAEDYDSGGEGVAYHDTTTANEGGYVMTGHAGEGVDIETSSSEASPVVCYIREGEWIRYTMTNAVAGTYPLTIRAGNWEAGTTKTVEVKVNGVTRATITVPMVASSSAFAEATANVPIPAGSHQVKLVFHGGKFNLNWFRI